MNSSNGRGQRPGKSSAAAVRAAAEAMAHALNANSVEAADSVARCWKGSKDGFTLAKKLEGESWDIDDEALEVIARRGDFEWEGQQIAVAAWVKERNIRPLCKAGEEVKFVANGGAEVSGVIKEVKGETAEYLIYCASLGHVASGVGTTGLVVPYESVHDLCDTPDKFQLESA